MFIDKKSDEKIKEAFLNVKSDIFSLETQILDLAREIHSLKRTIQQTDKPTDTDIHGKPSLIEQTDFLKMQTKLQSPQTHLNTKKPLEALKTSISNSSIRNEGVPTDRQTNQQTDKPPLTRTLSSSQDSETLKILNEPFKTKPHLGFDDSKTTQISKVSEIINSLDSLKKDILIMFKKLTPQEMQIYSTIYQLTNEGFIVDYPLLAQKTFLSESSARDYVLKLLKKNVPLEKTKENNKRIILSIPEEFKKIASLSTIISLREL